MLARPNNRFRRAPVPVGAVRVSHAFVAIARVQPQGELIPIAFLTAFWWSVLSSVAVQPPDELTISADNLRQVPAWWLLTWGGDPSDQRAGPVSALMTDPRPARGRQPQWRCGVVAAHPAGAGRLALGDKKRLLAPLRQRRTTSSQQGRAGESSACCLWGGAWRDWLGSGRVLLFVTRVVAAKLCGAAGLQVRVTVGGWVCIFVISVAKWTALARAASERNRIAGVLWSSHGTVAINSTGKTRGRTLAYIWLQGLWGKPVA